MKREKRSSMIKQASDTVDRMFTSGCGHSRHADKLNGLDCNTDIRSYGTCATYKKWACDYAKYYNDKDVRWLDDVKDADHVNAYLSEKMAMRKEDGSPQYTPSSLHTIKSAICKITGVDSKDTVELPERTRATITRSRVSVAYDKNYNLETGKYADYAHFIKHTGLRAYKEAAQLRGSDLRERPDGSFAVFVRCGKGGREREVDIIGTPAEIQRCVDTMRAAGSDNRVFPKIPKCDTHSMRADYAATAYRSFARPIEDVPVRERYYCRGDMVGTVFDREAMAKVSTLMGHNRVSVIAGNYLWALGGK